MKNIKLISVFLILIMFLTIIPAEFANADNFNDQYRYEMDFLGELGLIESDYDATFVVTKSEILVMILKALYQETDFSNSTDGKIYFSDVPTSHIYHSYITAAKNLGIVRGDGNNQFHPNEQITLNEGIAIIINALGYKTIAERSGGYPSGYYFVAKQIGLLKNIDLAAGDIISGGDAVRILYNALFTNVIEMVSIDSDGVSLSVNSSKNILGEKFSVYEYDGIITDNGLFSIEGSSTGDSEMVVMRESETGEQFFVYINGTDASDYIGCRVKAYVKYDKNNGKNSFVYISSHKKSETVTVNAKDVISAGDSYIEYEKNSDELRTHKVKIPEVKPVLIFNGIRIYDKTIKELIPKDGILKFIDNTGDGKIDVVLIYSLNYSKGSYTGEARNIIVDSVITAEGEEGISCLFNPAASIDLNDDEYTYMFAMSGDISSLSDIKSGMVVSVAEAPEKTEGKTCYILMVSSVVEEGILSYIEDDDSIVFENGTKYDLSESILSVKPAYTSNLKTGENITACLDVTGKVAYVKTAVKSTKDYAYIVKAVKKNRGEEEIIIKFFSKDGKMYEMPLSSKAVIDGENVAKLSTDKKLEAINERPSVASTLANAEATGRPAIIKVFNGMVVSIDTDTPNPSLSEGNISETYTQQSVIQYYESDAESYDTLKAGFRSPRAATVRGTSKTVGGRFFITSDTVVLWVPEIDTYGLKNLEAYRPYGYANIYLNSSYPANLDMIAYYELPNTEENYKVINVSQLYAAFSLDLQGYDIDPDTGVAGLVMVRGRKDVYKAGNISASNPMGVFINKTEAYDESAGKIITKIYYWENGEKKSALIDTEECYYAYKALINGCSAGDTPHNVAVKPLRNGDIIRVIQSTGKITHIERVLKIDNVKDAYGFFKFSTNTAVPYSKKVASADSLFPYDMPTVGDRDVFNIETSNAVSMSYPVKLKGNTLQLAFTKEDRALFSAIDFNNSASYSKLYCKVATDNITVINIPEGGKDAEIRKGTLNDIITLEDVNNDLSKASVIMAKVVSYELNHIIILNGLDNL